MNLTLYATKVKDCNVQWRDRDCNDQWLQFFEICQNFPTMKVITTSLKRTWQNERLNAVYYVLCMSWNNKLFEVKDFFFDVKTR